jgi:1-pyrroline-5-carboxylate dehydrogenase
MNNAIFTFESPQNEPILQYAPGTAERVALENELKRLLSDPVDIPLVIGGREIETTRKMPVYAPHDHQNSLLANVNMATEKEVELAITEALRAKNEWAGISWIERSSIMLKAAELISKKYRWLIVASTMLGQSKNAYQSEIDAACEMIDFLRYNVYFASQIYGDQPKSEFSQLNRLEYRPLEGFVFAVSPFNFTSIASNLNMAVALMGNTTVWKPASTSLLSNYYLMKIFQEAGLPDGVVNFVPGSGSLIGNAVLKNRHLAGIHFTGSNSTFNTLWRGVTANLEQYVSYPKLVGETGGKDFIFVHNSSDPLEVSTAIVRGAFEYQGQKCSAASRAYIPESLWPEVKSNLVSQVASIRMGSVMDFGNFMNAVIDGPAYDSIMRYIDLAKDSRVCEILTGGHGDASNGWFIEPTIIVTKDPMFTTMQQEIFGPVMTIYVYPDQKYEETLHLCDQTSPYGLTGAIFSKDKYASIQACRILRYAAGNFYMNDKPTGAMVGLQPFGGARASGTNDKSGGSLNLLRWISPRTIKETFLPARDIRYPFMG